MYEKLFRSGLAICIQLITAINEHKHKLNILSATQGRVHTVHDYDNGAPSNVHYEILNSPALPLPLPLLQYLTIRR